MTGDGTSNRFPGDDLLVDDRDVVVGVVLRS